MENKNSLSVVNNARLGDLINVLFDDVSKGSLTKEAATKGLLQVVNRIADLGNDEDLSTLLCQARAIIHKGEPVY